MSSTSSHWLVKSEPGAYAFADLVRKVLSNDRLLTAILEMAPPEPPAAAPSNTPPSS